MKVAVIQTNAVADKERNIEKALRAVRRAIAQKAKFILLPPPPPLPPPPLPLRVREIIAAGKRLARASGKYKTKCVF